MIVRKPDSPQNVDGVWNPKHPFISHYYTTYALLVPESENYIVRSSKKFYKDSIHKEDLKKCFAQEGNHSLVHSEFSQKYRQLDYKLDKFLSLYKKISYYLPEKYCSKKFNLVGAAASEQMNTAISSASLRIPELEDGPGETLQMLKWHFLEEIEHREVIFNLMEENKVNFFLKLYVMFNFLIGFCIWLPAGAILLGVQDGSAKKLKFWTEGLTHSLRMMGHFFMASFRFCWPTYHPKHEKLPQQYFALQSEFATE